MAKRVQIKLPDGSYRDLVDGENQDKRTELRVVEDRGAYQVAFYETAPHTYCPFAEITPIGATIRWSAGYSGEDGDKKIRDDAMARINKIVQALTAFDTVAA